MYVNGGTIGAETQLPFGGVRDTGNGHRDAGRIGLDNFTEWKTTYVDYSGRLQRAQIDNQLGLTDSGGGSAIGAWTSDGMVRWRCDPRPP